MLIELELIAGRYHATPWGRHPNEGVTEWPPSPFRLHRALLDAWFRKGSDIPEELVAEVLGALATPPVFRLPAAIPNHTRSFLSQNKADTTDKKLVFDAFMAVDPMDPCLVGWPGLHLRPELDAIARRLLGSLAYLGRSESWVEARVVEDRNDIVWNCIPATEDGTRGELVNVAGIVPPSAFDASKLPPVTTGRGRLRTSRPLRWLEALTWGSAEVMEHSMNRPPALEWLVYQRDDAPARRPTSRQSPANESIDTVVFAVEGRVLPRMTRALRIGERARSSAYARYRDVTDGATSLRLSGHGPDGAPAEGHRHASFLVRGNASGRIHRLVAWAPEPFETDELRALDRLDRVFDREGLEVRVTPIARGLRKELFADQTYHKVVSSTPFVPTRHWRERRDGPFLPWLREEVGRCLEFVGLPRPVHVALTDDRHRSPRWLEYARGRKGDAPHPGYGLELTFETPVQVPFTIGRHQHFGLGCFEAQQRASR